jgi:diguanylate cyclase (GGDEF)-like protein
MDRLERALGRVKRHQTTPFAVLAVSVDGLKTVKDTMGYVSADQLLVEVARALQECLPDQDSVAHCDEEEFVILLEGVRTPEDAVSAATRIHNRLEKPFEVDGQTVYVTANTGITLSNGDYTSPEELLRDASTAMRRAKADGKGRCEMFDRQMRSSAVAHLKLEADFRKAMERQEIAVHYQPIVCLRTGTLIGFEALVRWQRAETLLFPGDFLGIAEATDLILPLEDLVLLESCKQTARWQSMYGRPLKLNVNLCPRHYSDPHLIGLLKESLEVSGLDPTSLHLEITETALMENTETIQHTLSRIQKMNIQVHMDDFGTGYSSLSYLHRFPIDALKIDRSFVGKLGMNNETWKITQAIVSLAKTLGLGVTAEGVENLMQVRMLQTLGCDRGQGYYFSRPADSGEIESLLEEQPPWALAFEDNVLAFPFAAAAR